MAARTFCNISATRNRDYDGHPMESMAMTLFAGASDSSFPLSGPGFLAAAGSCFMLYGSRTDYSSGSFSYRLFNLSGMGACYGLSRMHAAGREIPFREIFVTPLEELRSGDAFLESVLGRSLITEAETQADVRPVKNQVFASALSRTEVSGLPKNRLRLLCRAAALLCAGEKVLLIERDPGYTQDYFRPLLRALFELIPAAQRCEVSFSTGRCARDLAEESVRFFDLIVTDQDVAQAAGRSVLRLSDFDGEGDGQDTGFLRWAGFTNAQRDRYAAYLVNSRAMLGSAAKTVLECMDEEASFWWLKAEANGSIPSVADLIRRHSDTPIVRIPEQNQAFCRRIPDLLAPGASREDLYFQLRMDKQTTPAQKQQALDYLQNQLNYFGLGEESYKEMERDFMDFTSMLEQLARLEQTVTQLQQDVSAQRTAAQDSARSLADRVNLVNQNLNGMRDIVNRGGGSGGGAGGSAVNEEISQNIRTVKQTVENIKRDMPRKNDQNFFQKILPGLSLTVCVLCLLTALTVLLSSSILPMGRAKEEAPPAPAAVATSAVMSEIVEPTTTPTPTPEPTPAPPAINIDALLGLTYMGPETDKKSKLEYYRYAGNGKTEVFYRAITADTPESQTIDNPPAKAQFVMYDETGLFVACGDKSIFKGDLQAKIAALLNTDTRKLEYFLDDALLKSTLKALKTYPSIASVAKVRLLTEDEIKDAAVTGCLSPRSFSGGDVWEITLSDGTVLEAASAGAIRMQETDNAIQVDTSLFCSKAPLPTAIKEALKSMGSAEN